jgi:P2-related tail formation protein
MSTDSTADPTADNKTDNIDARTGDYLSIVGPRNFANEPSHELMIRICEGASKNFLSEIQKIYERNDIDSLPENILDKIALEENLPSYFQDLPIATKRFLVKNDLSICSQLGTPYSVKQLVKQTFGYAQVIEYFEDKTANYAYDPSRMTATASSTADSSDPAYVIDGKSDTEWRAKDSDKQYLTLAIDQLLSVNELSYQPGKEGRITQYQIHTSQDGAKWTDAASGIWVDDHSVKTATWPPVDAQYVRITAIATADKGPPAIAELDLFAYGSGKPKTFRILVSDQLVDKQKVDALMYAIDSARDEASQLTSIGKLSKGTSSVYLGNATAGTLRSIARSYPAR